MGKIQEQKEQNMFPFWASCLIPGCPDSFYKYFIIDIDFTIAGLKCKMEAHHGVC